MTKKTITQTEYYQLAGLLFLAKDHVDALDKIVKAMQRLTGDKEDTGHCSDAAYCCYTAERLLENLGITVKESK